MILASLETGGNHNEYDCNHHYCNHLFNYFIYLLGREEEMMYSRRNRKIYNLGKRDGYELGYAQGLHDGNPFNSVIEALSNFASSVAEAVKQNPNLLAELNKHDEEEELE